MRSFLLVFATYLSELRLISFWTRVPANVKFEVDDVESPWVQGKKYDYIFCRIMAAAIADWPKLVKNIYEYVVHFYFQQSMPDE